MSKSLIIGDMHYGFNMSDYFLSIQQDILNSIINFLENNEIDNVVFLGDIYDKRFSTETRIVNTFREYHKQIKSLCKEVIVLAGNHDCYYTNTNQFTSLPNFFQNGEKLVIDTPLEIDNLFFIPWVNESNRETIHEFVRQNNKKGNILFGHLELSGFSYGGKTTSEDHLYKNDYKKYTKVFSGHYHEKQKKENIIYVGMPYQKNFGECGKKFIHMYDSVENELYEFENENWIFRKYIIEEGMSDSQIREQFKDVKNKFVKIYVNSSELSYVEKIERIVDSYEPYSRDMKFKNEEIEYKNEETIRNEIDSIMDDEQLHKLFFSEIEFDSSERKERIETSFNRFWNLSKNA